MRDQAIGRIEQLTRYTRGPWELEGRAIIGRAFDKSARLIVDHVRGGSAEAAIANARLIAAAPELLHALKALAADYEALCGDGMTEATQPTQLRDARAAIAKAEGQ